MNVIWNWHPSILPMSKMDYRGRFAPTPSGLLHAGSLATALASWLDAKSVDGTWLIRIEDIDLPRIQDGAAAGILSQLSSFGLESDEPVVYQSSRISLYEQSLHQLISRRLIYPCSCSRKKIEDYYLHQGKFDLPNEERVYPGFCRHPKTQSIDVLIKDVALRIAIPQEDNLLHQKLSEQVGDFILRRADQVFSYHLAVVVDDADQKITHVVRGRDLESCTSRQVFLQQALGFSTPKYLHIPIVINEQQEKLSKQTKAPIVLPNNRQEALQYLHKAGAHLNLGLPVPSPATTIQEWLSMAVNAWPYRTLPV